MLFMKLQVEVEQIVSVICVHLGSAPPLGYVQCSYLPPRASPNWLVSSSQGGAWDLLFYL